MQRLILLFAIAVFCSMPLFATEPVFDLRTWTKTDGKKARGTFVQIKGDVVTLRNETGDKTFTVRLNDLSTTDKNYLRNQHVGFIERIRSDKESSEQRLAASGEIISLYDKDAAPISAGFTKVYRSPFTAARSVAYSLDGRFVLVWGHNNEALLWDNFNGRKEKAFKGNTSGAEIVAFSGDGRFNASGYEGNKVVLHDTLTGNTLRLFEGHTGLVRPVAVSPDGLWVLSGATDNTAILWNVETGEMERRFEGHQGRVLSVAFHPKGEHLLTGDDHGTAILWNIKTGSVNRRNDKVGGSINSVSFNQDGAIAMLIAPNTAILWDTYIPPPQQGTTPSSSSQVQKNPILGDIKTLPLVLPNDPQVRDGLFDSVAFSKDNSFFMLVSRPGNVYFGNLKKKEWIRKIDQLESGVNRAAFDAQAKEYLTVSFNDNAILWDNETGEKVDEMVGYNYCVNPIRMTKDGRRILTSGGWADPTIAVWDTESGRLLKRLEGHQAAVRRIEILPNGKRILSASFEKFDDRKHGFGIPADRARRNPDRQVILWDISTGKALVNVENAIGWAVNPNGSQLITATSDGRSTDVTFWDTQTGRKVRETKGANVGSDFLFHPDGTRILAKRGNDSFNWVANNGNEAGIYRNMTYDVWTAQFAARGKFLLTGTIDGKAILWNLLRDTPQAEFGGHAGGITSVAISADAKRALTGSVGKTAILWNAETGEEIRELEAGEGSIVGVDFTDDGKLAMVASEDGTVKFYGIDE